MQHVYLNIFCSYCPGFEKVRRNLEKLKDSLPLAVFHLFACHWRRFFWKGMRGARFQSLAAVAVYRLPVAPSSKTPTALDSTSNLKIVI